MLSGENKLLGGKLHIFRNISFDLKNETSSNEMEEGTPISLEAPLTGMHRSM